MSERNFRRHIDRYEADGLSGLLEKRLSQISHRKVTTSEMDHVVHQYKSSFAGELAFQTHQGRLPQELARAGIIDMEAANRYLEEIYRPAFNREFAKASTMAGTAYVPFLSGSLPDILCEQHERKVDNNNTHHARTQKFHGGEG